VIHEGQITHAEHGLEKVLDLGEWWHEKTKLPLPLGIDIIRRDLGLETIGAFSQLFKESIEYALNHRAESLEYASQFGRGISGDLNDRFVAMYVNERTIDIGRDGEAGFRTLLDQAFTEKIISHKVNLEFI
jgi:1,4-dihydroxy-6-naphthoate synthase